VYTYVEQVMPPEIYDRMQLVIILALKALRGHTKLPIWLNILQGDREPFIYALENWQSDYAQRLLAAQFMMSAEMSAAPRSDDMTFASHPDASEGIKEEQRRFRDCAMILPPASTMHNDLRTILAMSKNESRSTKLRKYIASTWKPNVTMVDFNWVRQSRMGEYSIDVGHDPFDLVYCFCEGVIPSRPQNAQSPMDYVAPFFVNAARSLSAIRDRLTVEWIPGDVAPILENINSGLMRDRDPTYPCKYDRIHASNIP
jgi:hypothetical protein